MRSSHFAFAALAAAGLVALAGQAAAHAHLLSSDPTAGAKVAPPKAVVLHFSERLEPKFSGLELTKAGGAPLAVVVAVPERDRKALRGELAQPLGAGEYRVSWHAVSADGHRTQGAFAFTVR